MAEFTTRLAPEDEYPHTPDAAANYNESMYFNMFDPAKKVGGWFRIGNRPNEHYAEMTVCLYLPGKRVAFMFKRAEISGNTEMNAGGLKVEVIDPFKKLRVTYDGKMLVMDNPNDMADPASAFKKNPALKAKIDLEFEGVSPMHGGEIVRTDGKPMNVDPEKSFAKAHYEQHMAAKGSFTVGEESFEVSGFGLRDKSWGPRHWQAIDWYRWCPMNFGKDFGVVLSTVGGRSGGMVLKDGKYENIKELTLDTVWDEHWHQKSLKAKLKTESGAAYEIEGEVISLIPLRNRRKTPDGEELMTRITEGFTEYRCNGMTGYGLSEYLDQIKDGRPSGADVK